MCFLNYGFYRAQKLPVKFSELSVISDRTTIGVTSVLYGEERVKGIQTFSF